MRNNFRLYILLTFVLTLIAPTIIFAEQTENQKKVKVKQNLNSTELLWDLDADLFVISDNEDKVIYKGNKKEFTVNNLSEDSVQSYDLKSFKNGVVIDNYQIITSTNKGASTDKLVPNRINTPKDLDASLTSIVSEENIVLDWNDIPDVEEYKIYKNQTHIATVKDSSYTDTNITENDIYTYEIQFIKPLSENERKDIDNFYKGLKTEVDKTKFENQPISIIRIVETQDAKPESNEQSTVSIAATSTSSFSWYYKTFIPMKYADDPIPGNGIAYFGGDNRTFSFESEKFRTKMWGKTTFSDYDSTHQFSKDIGLTTAYDSNYQLVDSAYASDEYIYGNKNTHTYSKADYMYYHKSGNPFVPVSGQEIDIQMRVITNSNGTYSFEGLHDRAPSHELYLSLNNGVSNRMIFAHPHEGFEYLGAPSTLARYFYISGAY